MKALAVACATLATAVLIAACGGSGGLIPADHRASSPRPDEDPDGRRRARLQSDHHRYRHRQQRLQQHPDERQRVAHGQLQNGPRPHSRPPRSPNARAAPRAPGRPRPGPPAPTNAHERHELHELDLLDDQQHREQHGLDDRDHREQHRHDDHDDDQHDDRDGGRPAPRRRARAAGPRPATAARPHRRGGGERRPRLAMSHASGQHRRRALPDREQARLGRHVDRASRVRRAPRALRRPQAARRAPRSDPAFVSRFQREALAAARLIHPNIVQVFDSGLDDYRDQHYIVMEYIDGQSCAEILRDRGWLPSRRPCRSSSARARGSIMPTARASSIATSSRATCCWESTAPSSSPTSASPRRPSSRASRRSGRSSAPPPTSLPSRDAARRPGRRRTSTRWASSPTS